MIRSTARRLVLLPLALVMANFAGFAYAYAALRVHQAGNPFGSPAEANPAIGQLYLDYLRRGLGQDFGTLPIAGGQPVSDIMWNATGASLGLLALVLALSASLGLLLGVRSVNAESARVTPALSSLSAVGLALPGFYLGALFVAAAVAYILRGGEGTEWPLPLSGFGWDLHLVLPVLALLVRPTTQIARLTSALLADEMGRQYIIAARSRGNSWSRAQSKHALRNVWAPLILTIAASFRLIIGELILVEWLFSWPGLGRLFALVLIAPRVASLAGFHETPVYFLNPPLLAGLMTIFGLLFLGADLAASFLIHRVDPRLRSAVPEQGIE